MKNKGLYIARIVFGLWVISFCSLPLLSQAQAQNERIPVLIKFKEKPGANEQALVNALGGNVKRTYRIIPAMAADIPTAALESLRSNPRVELVEFDEIQTAIATPNDPEFNLLWGLNNTGQSSGTPEADISATAAWDEITNTGPSENAPIVAIVDTGAQVGAGFFGTNVTHPDLAANIWVNTGEIAGNSLDDDNNGYIDDIHGWNFYDETSWLFYDADEDFHGTHVAGTIGGVGNNGIGVPGVSWGAQLMILKFLGPGGTGYTSDAIIAIEYAAANGASIISASWGGGGFSQTLKDAIEASGCLFVAAAGNGGADQVGDDTDVEPHYPSAYDSANIIAVAATDRNDNRAGFSNFGPVTVDLGAPGVSILSTYPGSTYQYMNGTSMATPHVSGVASLILGQYPEATPAQVKEIILSSVDPIDALDGISVTGGRLNAHQAVIADLPVGPPPPEPAAPNFASADFSSSSSQVIGNYTDTHEQDDVYESITERESGGRPSRRHDFLSHIWSIDLTGGNYMFNLDAHHSEGGDMDDGFIFEWSTSSSGPWTNMFTVSNKTDEDVYQTFPFSVSSGTVYVRARDDNDDRGQKSFDTLRVDCMFVDGGDGSVGPPPPPTGDNTSPVLMNIGSAKTHPKNGSFEITWNTDEPATSDVMIDFAIYRDTDPAMVTSHRRTFKGARGALYVYFVESMDAAGNTATSAEHFHQN